MWLAVLVVVGTAATDAVAAAGAGLQPGQSVRERHRPETAAKGVRLGRFLAYLSAGVVETYDDNLFAEDSDPTGDFVTTVRPRLEIASQWRRHGLRLSAGAERQLHSDTPDEDILDYAAVLEGRLDLGRDGLLRAAAGYLREHEDRGAPEDPDGLERTPIDRLEARAVAEQHFARLGLAFAASYTRRDFGDVPARGGGHIDNDDRDRDTARLAARVSYGLTADLEPFVDAAYETVDFARPRNRDGLDRDSRAVELAVGGRYRRAGIGLVELRLGLRRQRIADPALDEVLGVMMDARWVQQLTPLTSVTVAARRELQQSTLASTAAVFATRLGARLDHELRRDLLLGADAAVRRNTFTGTGREDLILGAGVDVTYLASRYLQLTLDYGFTRRLSNAEAGFTRNRVSLGARLQY